MERYVLQLIEKIDEICDKGFTLPFIEIPPEMQEFPEIAEFELSEDKPVSVWSGIDICEFPEPGMLTENQKESLSEAMLRVFDTLNIAVELPEEISISKKYDLMLYCWADSVPYLSQPGFHLDFALATVRVVLLQKIAGFIKMGICLEID